jgi:hypothetical protein
MKMTLIYNSCWVFWSKRKRKYRNRENWIFPKKEITIIPAQEYHPSKGTADKNTRDNITKNRKTMDISKNPKDKCYTWTPITKRKDAADDNTTLMIHFPKDKNPNANKTALLLIWTVINLVVLLRTTIVLLKGSPMY